ncbi:MAG: class I SAM-dependent methyltransferase [Terriglobales bacterium]
MGECRNCGAQATRDLGFIGAVAPFFLKRVLNLECDLAPSGHPVKRFLRRISFLSKSFEKIYGKSVLVEIEICTSCSFIQTKLPFPDEAIGRLYTDYRSDSYNRERTRYEPEYAPMASQAGSCVQEIQARTFGLTRWLTGKLNVENNFSMLDYGGADGKFLPNLPGEKCVFDISNIAPAGGVKRIHEESGLGSYSYIQLAHVLEHVSYPLVLTRKAASFLRDSGYLYIEVPLEVSEEATARLANGDKTIRLGIHEHINRYTAKSVTELLRSVGLSLTAVETEEVDLGWNKTTIVRALGRKL